MMDFFTLDDALLAEAFNEKEAASLLQTRRSLPADPVPGICAGLAARMRNAVLAGGRAHLPADALAVPMALRGEATAILRVKLLTRFALAITEERKREAEAAENRLDAIAKGEIPFVDATPAARPAYYGRKRHRRQPQNGGIM